MNSRSYFCLGVVFVALCAVRSGAEIALSHSQFKAGVDTRNIRVECTVSNGEAFIGWYRKKDNTKITTTKPASGSGMYVTSSGDKHTLFIPIVRSTFGGEYTCKGDVGEKIFTLQIGFKIPPELTEGKMIDLHGTDRIEIGAHGYPQPTYEWKKDDKLINFADAHYVVDTTTGDLEIKDVRESDQGNYTCSITQFFSGEKVYAIQVFVVEEPKITERPTPATRSLTVGYNVTFTCDASGLPAPTIEWKNPNNDKVSNWGHRFTVDGGTLTVTGIIKNDVGNWTCEARNKRGTKKAIVHIKEVLVAPEIVIKPTKRPVIKSEGDEFKLICVVSGTPVPTIRWLKEGRIFPYKKDIPRKQIDDETYHAYQQVTHDITDPADTNRSFIQFREVSMWRDMGEYKCEAWNTARDGEDRPIVKTESVTLLVRSEPILVKAASPGEVYSFLDNPEYVRIHCEYKGHPTPNVTIWRGWWEVANGTSFADFWLKTDDIEDFGEFGCVGENEYGSKNHTILLKYARPPGKPRDVTYNATCNSVTLRWEEPLDTGGMPIMQYFVTLENEYTKTVNVPKMTDPVYGRQLGNSYTVHGLQRKLRYSLFVEARSKGARGEPKNVLAWTKEFCRPGRPTITAPTTRQLKENTIILAWDPPPNDGGDSEIRYQVQYKEVIGGTAKEETFPDSTGTQFRFPGLKSGVTYRFRVYAINRGGVSEPAEAHYRVQAKVAARGRAQAVSASVILVLASLLIATSKLFL